MTRDLLIAKEYGTITFVSTSNALKAEKVLREAEAIFVMMPTPREISTSCGLSVKVYTDALKETNELLLEHQVKVEGIYKVNRLEKGNSEIERVER